MITGEHATVVDGQVVDDDVADTLRTKAGLAVGRFEAHQTAGHEHPTRLTCGHTQPVGPSIVITDRVVPLLPA